MPLFDVSPSNKHRGLHMLYIVHTAYKPRGGFPSSEPQVVGDVVLSFGRGLQLHLDCAIAPIVMAYTVMAYIVMAYSVMACMVLAYIVMTAGRGVYDLQRSAVSHIQRWLHLPIH